ncbi:hypothetical protein JCM11641_002693 [Rhodosporidiobolus odoratus]
MRSSTLIAAFSTLAAVASADFSPVPLPPNTNPVLPPTDISLNKRDLCIFGVCVGGGGYSSSPSAQYLSDVNNCGSRGNRCSSSWSSGGGKQCVNGVCGPQYCNNLFDFNWLTGNCQDVSSDSNNCGKCGQTCSVDNASGTKCISGSCYATACSPGYTLASGVCTKNIDTTSDVKNCGSVGNKCPASYSYGSGSVCSNGVCQPQSCNSGFGFDFAAQKCRDITSDTNHCGSCGNVCQFPNGSGQCVRGSCTLKSCSNGYYNIDGTCKRIDTLTDIDNCGSVGNTCSYPNGVSTCKSGSCQLSSCNKGYEFKTSYWLWWSTGQTCEAVDTSSDTDNCGAIGNACPSSVPHGSSPTCSKGKCVSTCGTGYDWDTTSLSCQNTNSDLNNCGSIGNVCKVDNGVAQCVRGSCSASSCSSGFALQNGKCVNVDTNTDPKNCGLIGTICPSSYKNGGLGVCLDGKCQTACDNLFDFDFFLGFCRDVSSDTQNCGRCGQSCSLPGAKATTCNRGKCAATACNSGYTLSNGACSQTDTTCDVNNCGAVGRACQFSPAGASGICQSSTCVTTSCPAGYSLKSGVCVKITASQQARLSKKDKILEPKALCPAKEEACPILGSTSYATAVDHHFNAATQFSGIMLGNGGYECVDTMQALDSCGGCASTGEGADCTRIRGAAGVGCEVGVCRVFSCESGWKPSLKGDKCVRIKAQSDSSSHHHHRNSTSVSSSSKRHLAARHHGHHHASHL